MKICVDIKGVSPLLMNRFVDAALSNSPRDKNLTPREEAEKVCYKNKKEELFIPGANIFSCLIVAGKYHKLGKNKVTTMKSSLVPAALSIKEIECLLTPQEFEVDSRSVVIPSTGGRIMKHRPCLEDWAISFTLTLDTTMFSERFARTIVDDAGSKVGLGDYRPDRKGPFGKFKVTKWKVDK